MLTKDKNGIWDEVFKKLAAISQQNFNEINLHSERITSADLYKAMGKGPYRTFQNKFMDSSYRVLTAEAYTKALELLSVDKKHYQSEFFDCDDFAWVSKGLMSFVFEINGVGWVCDYSGRHSFLNVCVLDESAKDLSLSIQVIEPQTNLRVKKFDDAYVNVGNGFVIW